MQSATVSQYRGFSKGGRAFVKVSIKVSTEYTKNIMIL